MMSKIERLVNRRGALEILGVLGAAFAAGCSTSETTGAGGAGGSGGAGGAGGGASTTGTTATTGSTGTGTATCTAIPEETAGPYPDKTGMFDNKAFYRQDVTEGKTGIPLSLTLTVVDVSGSCSAVGAAVVEIWHCDKDGVYSEYTGQPGVSADESATTFLRGLQTTDGSGQVTFSTIFPGWYAGRATHVHIEVFVDGKSVKTTQMAFPEAITTAVYGSTLYAAKGQNPMKNEGDMVFGDGDTYELGDITGDTTSGYKAALVIGI